MSFALLVAWLLMGIGQDVWWDFAADPAVIELVDEAGDVQKMDGTEEPPPKP